MSVKVVYMTITPEGRVKKAIKSVLDPLEPDLWQYWPVPSGYGKQALDCLLCYHGQFAAIEAKAPRGTMTAMQELVRDEIEKAGGVVFEIDGPEGLEQLKAWLEQCRS